MVTRSDEDSSPFLHAVRSGPGAGARTIVLVHGFTQTSASWEPAARDLSRDHPVVCVDAPGHGGSSHLSTDLVTGAALLGRTGSPQQEANPFGPPIYVGYSMGGRLALRLALDRPDLIGGLVLSGATAGIEDARERTDRRLADEALARRIEVDGVEAFLQDWLAQPLFEHLRPTPEDLAARHTNTATGLASSLRLAGTATMDPPWWGELTTCTVPTLVVAGARDAKFRRLGQRLAARLGDGRTARFTTVAGTGHAAHLEDPATFAALVRSFAAGLVNR